MTARFRVVQSVGFLRDIDRLEEHIVQRELASETPDEDCVFRFRDSLERALGILSFAPHTCRRSADQREFRELIVPFGHGGCVALFCIRDDEVLLLSARDQHERDYR